MPQHHRVFDQERGPDGRQLGQQRRVAQVRQLGDTDRGNVEEIPGAVLEERQSNERSDGVAAGQRDQADTHDVTHHGLCARL